MTKVTRIPSMTALRAFDAVARHLNFRKAAAELNVTHAAVSHQIKALEAELGVSLFDRTSRSVRLTKAAKIYFPVVENSLSALEQVTLRVRKQTEHDVLHVRSYGSFITMWLTPRLSEFQNQHPRLRIRLISSFEDFGAGGFDVGVFKSLQDDGRFIRQELFRTEIFPVCSADTLEGTELPADLGILKNHRLLNVPANEAEPNDWDLWMDTAKVSENSMKIHATFDTYPLARDAALKGMGMAMARHPFAAADIQCGRLIRPFEEAAPEPGKWYLYVRKQIATEPRTKTFCEWLHNEINNDPTCLQDRQEDQTQ
ncbi:MAG: LysR family transcriptional regulator [Alphaproteobacteria bacterium]|nr:LysR family transcriptional regulator [Alphaproteobacteria bacterium]